MPANFIEYGVNPATEMKLFVAELPRLELLKMIELPAQPGTVFIAADMREISTDDIADVAERLLRQGLRYLCAWGPDCQRAHDIFDEVYVGAGDSPYDFDLMTTWHEDESIGEALWFFLNCAFIDEQDISDLASFAVRIGDPEGSVPILELIPRIDEFTD